MTAIVVKIKESDGWVNLTAAAGLVAGDVMNIQNIGSAAAFLQTSVAQPVGLGGVDYLYQPKENPISPKPTATESVWGNTQGLGETKLSVAESATATISNPILETSANTEATVSIAKGVPTSGLLLFSRIGVTVEDVFAFKNNELKPVSVNFLANASNNANSATGAFVITAAVTIEELTGGASFLASEILQIREPINIDAKINPTNTPTFFSFEKVYVSANGGTGTQTLDDFVINPGDTMFLKLGGFLNIVELSFFARFSTI